MEPRSGDCIGRRTCPFTMMKGMQIQKAMKMDLNIGIPDSLNQEVENFQSKIKKIT
jgi:hypothetical protein